MTKLKNPSDAGDLFTLSWEEFSKKVYKMRKTDLVLLAAYAHGRIHG